MAKSNSQSESRGIKGVKDLQEAMLQLQKSKERLKRVLSFQKTLLDTAGAMIIATDEHGVITLFNAEAALNLQYSKEEVINLQTPVLFHDNKEIEKKQKQLENELGTVFENSFEVLVARAKQNIHEEQQCTYIRKDGSSFPVLLTITSLQDAEENITGYMGVAIDISERIKAEKELKKVEQLFLQLLKNYPDGTISIIDKNFHFVYTGGELHQRLKADISKLIGKKIYPHFPQPLRDIILDKLEKIFKEKIYIPDFELPFAIENHNYIMDAFPLMEEDGSVNYIGVIIKNISKLKQAEEGLREALQIEKNLGELKSRFVSMASHEFRTPLSTVLSSAYLIEKYTDTEDQPKREKHLQRIVSSVNMLTDILNEFLNVGKIEEGKLQAKISEFNIAEVIQLTIEEIKNNLKKSQTLHYHHEGSPVVYLDSSLMKHIVLNLISNAAKFSPDKSEIKITTVNEDDKVLLMIKDNGIGISKEDQKHLTERFFRGSNAGNIQGTGLGLHIVSKYAEMMDGKIKCKSELEKGTEFILTFTKNVAP